MDAKSFVNLVQKNELLDENTANELKELIAKYPYFQTAHALYLKNLAVIKNNDFGAQLNYSAVFTSDRNMLFGLIHQSKPINTESTTQQIITEQKQEVSKETVNQVTEILTEKKKEEAVEIKNEVVTEVNNTVAEEIKAEVKEEIKEETKELVIDRSEQKKEKKTKKTKEVSADESGPLEESEASKTLHNAIVEDFLKPRAEAISKEKSDETTETIKPEKKVTNEIYQKIAALKEEQTKIDQTIKEEKESSGFKTFEDIKKETEKVKTRTIESVLEKHKMMKEERLKRTKKASPEEETVINEIQEKKETTETVEQVKQPLITNPVEKQQLADELMRKILEKKELNKAEQVQKTEKNVVAEVKEEKKETIEAKIEEVKLESVEIKNEVIENKIETPVIEEIKVEKTEEIKEIIENKVENIVVEETKIAEIKEEVKAEIKTEEKKEKESAADMLMRKIQERKKKQSEPKEENPEGKTDDLIENFLKTAPTMKRNAESVTEEDIGLESIQEDENIASESLAKIYEGQGLYQKSIDVYQKLILKYPEKNSYFTAQIKILEDLITKTIN